MDFFPHLYFFIFNWYNQQPDSEYSHWRSTMIHKRLLPPLGHRIIKSAIAVFICLLIHILRGYNGDVAHSAVTAILCIQPYMADTRSFAIDRVIGTLLGSAWGFVFLLLLYLMPVLRQYILIVYFLMSFIVMLAIYSTVLLKKTSISALVAIVCLGILTQYSACDSPLLNTLNNLFDTIIGTFVAIFVNFFHLPRRKHPELLFFVRTRDIVPDRYRSIPSSVHIMLDHLYNDGARICLVSRWAPAFIISQMGLLNVNAPFIVMDGAALYDIKENRYLDVIEIPKPDAARLCEIIKHFGAGCNIYTVQNNTMSIFHKGEMNEAEQQTYAIMKRSPYRNYIDGDYHDEDKIALIRVLDTPERIEQLAYLVQSVLPPGMFRMELREDATFNEYRGLYFFSPKASVAEMKKRVLSYMEHETDSALKPVDILPRMSGYLPEHDAMLLLGRLKNAYEPIHFLPDKFKRKNRKN